MERDPQDQSADNQQLPERFDDLMRSALDDIEQREREAQRADDELAAALERQAELHRAAARDPQFEAEYEAITDKIRHLLAERRAREDPDPNQTTESE